VRLVLVVVAIGLAFVVRARIQEAKGKAAVASVPAQTVAVSHPMIGDIRSMLQFTGSMEAIQQASIYSRVNGYVEKVLVNRGDAVRAGQPLVIIDHIGLQQAMQSAAAGVQVAQGNLVRDEASLANAKLSFERTRNLAQQGILSRSQLDDAQARLNVAEAQVAADHAAVEQQRGSYNAARTNLGYAEIKAPFAGIITQRNFDPGTYVTATAGGSVAGPGTAPSNNALLQVSDLNAVRVFVYVQEKDLAKVHLGEPVDIRVDTYPADVFHGTVSHTARALDPLSRAMQAEVDIPNRDGRLRPGMYARVALLTSVHHNAMAVPSPAVLSDGSQRYLFVVRGGRAHRQPVVTGDEDGDRTEILSGLGAGDEVVVLGANSLSEGSRLEARPFRAGEAAAQ